MIGRKSLSHKSGSMEVISSRLKRSKGEVSSTTISKEGQDIKEMNSFLEIISLTDKSEAAKRNIRMENTYKMTPDKLFKPHEVEKVAERILKDSLGDSEYDALQCRSLSETLSSKILEEIQSLGYKRYKMVCVVSIGSLKNKPGMQFGSRCLWNKDTDYFISVKYSNASLFAVAMVYGLYFD
ncbi:hypothetical protein CHS0354_003421 [Potamilus streckersoni]|uniref:Uncharacterized protein n=1 Tax=Potamilus streckersoni TaxID=2493646 RepID=A0AAE0VZY9_9BIVA|nr:hypothetical protein CHS0354_003421 [Potamilus streckersoni]